MTDNSEFGWSGPRPASLAARPWRVGDPDFLADRFDRPRRASPWAGHRNFAWDLIGYLAPRRIVELGTHYGCSFWAFCQAVADHGLSTEVIAVDTWEGDPHAGRYEGVYELVVDWLGEHFPHVDARLIRSQFDDAVRDIELGSVDLLHIDGFHSYEAASHDHQTWESRLSPTATVLFHDVDPASGYGSAEYWRELCARDGGWTFLHNFGLGVLTRHPELASLMSSDTFATIAQVYPARARGDLTSMQVEDLTALVEAKQAIIDQQDQLIHDRDEAIASQAALVEAKQAIIDHQDELIRDRDEAIAAQAALVDAKQAMIEQRDRLVSERDEQIAALSQRLQTH
jgi:hypothetical protein